MGIHFEISDSISFSLYDSKSNQTWIQAAAQCMNRTHNVMYNWRQKPNFLSATCYCDMLILGTCWPLWNKGWKKNWEIWKIGSMLPTSLFITHLTAYDVSELILYTSFIGNTSYIHPFLLKSRILQRDNCSKNDLYIKKQWMNYHVSNSQVKR